MAFYLQPAVAAVEALSDGRRRLRRSAKPIPPDPPSGQLAGRLSTYIWYLATKPRPTPDHFARLGAVHKRDHSHTSGDMQRHQDFAPAKWITERAPRRSPSLRWAPPAYEEWRSGGPRSSRFSGNSLATANAPAWRRSVGQGAIGAMIRLPIRAQNARRLASSPNGSRAFRLRTTRPTRIRVLLRALRV